MDTLSVEGCPPPQTGPAAWVGSEMAARTDWIGVLDADDLAELDGAMRGFLAQPGDPAARSKVLAMALVVACDIHPLNNLRVLKYLGSVLDVDEGARDDWYRHWVSQGLHALEAMAQDCGDYLSGATPGLADICLVPQMYNARRFETDLSAYPTLGRLDEALCALPAFEKAHPDAVRPA
jgi:maleylacetoacetate isomerase